MGKPARSRIAVYAAAPTYLAHCPRLLGHEHYLATEPKRGRSSFPRKRAASPFRLVASACGLLFDFPAKTSVHWCASHIRWTTTLLENHGGFNAWTLGRLRQALGFQKSLTIKQRTSIRRLQYDARFQISDYFELNAKIVAFSIFPDTISSFGTNSNCYSGGRFMFFPYPFIAPIVFFKQIQIKREIIASLHGLFKKCVE
jgi:hypothetical protein